MTVVRTAFETDLSSILSIAETSPFQPTDEAGRKSIEAHLREGRTLLALTDEGPEMAPAGYLLWRPHLWDGRPPFIEHIDVSPDFRKQGIGEALVTELERVAREMGFSAIYSSTAEDNAASRAFHAALGFEEDVLYSLRDQGVPEVMLSKQLS